MPTFNLFPRDLRSPGVRTTPVFGPVPIGVNTILFRFGRFDWPVRPGVPPESEVFRARAQVSFDGGSTWIGGGSVGTEGGNLTNFRTGAPSTETTLRVSFAQPNNPARFIRMQAQWREELDLDVIAELLTDGVNLP